MGDRIFGGFGLALAVFFIWQATQIQTSFISDPVGPKTFPIIIGVLLGLSCLAMILRPDAKPSWPPLARMTAAWCSMAVCLPMRPMVRRRLSNPISASESKIRRNMRLPLASARAR